MAKAPKPAWTPADQRRLDGIVAAWTIGYNMDFPTDVDWLIGQVRRLTE